MKLPDHTAKNPSPQHQERREFLKTAGAAVLGIISGCRGRVDSATKQAIKPPDTKWQKREVDPAIQRKDIPKILADRISRFGRICVQPENYDPSKPNLFLIANQHFPKIKDNGGQDLSPEEISQIYSIQEKNLHIFHILRELGVNRQFLEGIPEDLELKHDRRNPTVAENPVDAFPDYIQKGKIKRAYTAIEGLYGNEVKSIGTENIDKSLELHSRFKEFDSTIFREAIRQIKSTIALKLGINLEQPDRQVAQEFMAKLANLSQAEKDQIINDVVLKNQNYLKFLDAASKWYFERIQGRDIKMAETINESVIQDKSDSAFIIGSEHIGHFKDLFPAWNVFALAPDGIEDDKLFPFHSNFSLEDYRKCILDQDLYKFGLGPKPQNTLFD